VLTVRGLQAGYGQTRVLTGVDLHVDAGEFVVVLGPNGHGKTTMLRAISGLIPVRAGTVEFKGHRLDRARAESIVAHGITHIPQGDLLFPDMTVEENLLMGAFRSYATRADQLRTVYEIFPRLAERRTQRTRTLSGGERRMVALGRGLMSKADLLMIDEPSLGLAPVLVEEVYERIAEISRTGVTVLLVEENMAYVRSVADRVYLVESGAVVLEGTPEHVLENESVVATYLGVGQEGAR
jgi:branched-chain amino acid transport system ATP-binding protein